jgi:hypothetical protein
MAPTLRQRQHKGDGTNNEIAIAGREERRGPQPIPNKGLLQRGATPQYQQEKPTKERVAPYTSKISQLGESCTLYQQEKWTKERAAPQI